MIRFLSFVGLDSPFSFYSVLVDGSMCDFVPEDRSLTRS